MAVWTVAPGLAARLSGPTNREVSPSLLSVILPRQVVTIGARGSFGAFRTTAPSAFTEKAQRGSFPPAGAAEAARVEVRRSTPLYVPMKGTGNENAARAAVAPRATVGDAKDSDEGLAVGLAAVCEALDAVHRVISCGSWPRPVALTTDRGTADVSGVLDQGRVCPKCQGPGVGIPAGLDRGRGAAVDAQRAGGRRHMACPAGKSPWCPHGVPTVMTAWGTAARGHRTAGA